MIAGEDFHEIPTLDSLVAKMISTGFQATNLALAIKEIDRMLSWRLSDRGPAKNDGTEPEEHLDLALFFGLPEE